MNVFLIVCFILSAIIIAMGLVMLLKRKSFVSAFPQRNVKKAFNHCFTLPGIIFLMEIFLAIGVFVLVLCASMSEDKIGNGMFWAIGLLSGIVIGLLIGSFYWNKVKKPFFMREFPAQYKDYMDEVKRRWGKSRVRYQEVATVGNFIWPLYATGLVLGILLDLFL